MNPPNTVEDLRAEDLSEKDPEENTKGNAQAERHTVILETNPGENPEGKGTRGPSIA